MKFRVIKEGNIFFLQREVVSAPDFVPFWVFMHTFSFKYKAKRYLKEIAKGFRDGNGIKLAKVVIEEEIDV